MQLEGHAAIVTGGGSGLGAATARALVDAGMRVAIFDMNIDAARSVADDIGGHPVQCDVADSASAEAAVASAAEAHGAARVVVNCAGIGTPQKIVGRDGPSPLADFRRVIDVNLIGTYNILRLTAANMMALDPLDEIGERGVIVNTASVAAYEGQIGQSAYAASKGGVVALNIVAAREFASRGIRVMTIAPGLIGTPMLHGLPQEAQDSLAAQVPFPSRLGRPDEFADLVKHICHNQMLNGEVIRMDGAIRMAPR